MQNGQKFKINTRDITGIMILITKLQRKIEVLADCGINEKVEKSYWDNLVQSLTSDIAKGNLVDGLVRAIETCGESLSSSFPLKENDSNEISNDLIQQ